MDEQRRLPRWRMNSLMKVSFQDRYEFKDTVVEDMNLKGMCLSLPAMLPKNTPVRIELELLGRESVTVKALIPWIKERDGRYLHGLEFNQVVDSDRERIYQYINDRCMKQLEAGWWHDVR